MEELKGLQAQKSFGLKKTRIVDYNSGFGVLSVAIGNCG